MIRENLLTMIRREPMITLRTGVEVPKKIYNHYYYKLKRLDELCLYELYRKASNHNHEIYFPCREILVYHGFVAMYSMQMHDMVKAIVLAAVESNGFDVKVVSATALT